MTTQETVAANVRARLAWSQVKHEEAAKAAGCSLRSFRYRLAGELPFRTDELDGLARALGVTEVADFFRVPEGFPSRSSVPAWTRNSAGQPHLRLVPPAAAVPQTTQLAAA